MFTLCVCVFQSAEKASIQRLTESFVTKLQADFPSTVSTIYRSGQDAVIVVVTAEFRRIPLVYQEVWHRNGWNSSIDVFIFTRMIYTYTTHMKCSLLVTSAPAVSCRTSEKLQVACKSSSGADRSGTCLFCRCPLDTAVGEQQYPPFLLLKVQCVFYICGIFCIGKFLTHCL